MDWNLVLPELIVTGTGITVLLLDLYLPPGRRRTAGYLSALGLVAAVGAAVRLALRAGLTYGAAGGAMAGAGTGTATGAATGSAAGVAGAWMGMLAADPFALIFKILFAAVGLGVVLLGVDFVEKRRLPAGELNALVLFSVLGMMLMAGSRDLIMIYLGLETTSISSYALAGLLRDDPRSGEAAVKYFLTGALASAVILFGMSLVFGGTGSTSLAALAPRGVAGYVAAGWLSPVALAGLVLLVAGFGFKLAAVPFHFWAPDAYEGAPTPVTAFFSVGPKGAAFAAVLRVFGPVLNLVRYGAGSGSVLPLLFAILAVVTMTVGNLTALQQTNIKRMLAYSSIAHAGYILVGLAVATPRGLAAMIYYLLAYAAMNLGVFAVVIWLNNRGTGDDIADYAGLARRSPLAALAMVICFLSLIGIPPTAGFFGKFYLFAAAVEGRMTWLAVIMVINSAISVGYYYGVVRHMYLQGDVKAERPAEPVRGTPLVGLTLTAAVIAVLALGFLFEPLARLTGIAGAGL